MHRVCSVQNGRRTLLSRRACFYADEIYARASADRRTDRVSLPLCFNSLVAIFSLALSLFASSPQSSVGLEPSLSYPPSYDTFSLSLSSVLPRLFLLLCVFSVGPLSPIPSINLPSFSLSLALRYPTPTPLSFFYFSIFRISLSVFVFVSRRCRYYFYPPRPVASFVPRVSSTLSAQTILLPPTFCFLYRMIVCGALLPAYSYAPSPFNIPALLQKAAPVSAFCSTRVSRTREKVRGDGRENSANETKTRKLDDSFPSVESEKSGNARKHKFSRQSLIRKRDPCHRSHRSLSVDFQRNEPKNEACSDLFA